MFEKAKEVTANVKVHVSEYRYRYMAGAAGVVVGGVAVALFSGRVDSGAQVVQKVIQLGLRNTATPTVINLIERSTASKPVHLVGTNLYFNSISEAARETGHHLSQLSKHINGQIPDLKGDVFQLLEIAA